MKNKTKQEHMSFEKQLDKMGIKLPKKVLSKHQEWIGNLTMDEFIAVRVRMTTIMNEIAYGGAYIELRESVNEKE